MNTVRLIKVAIAASMLFSATAFGQQLVTSKHNMTLNGNYDNTGNTSGQVCVYCHTPHSAVTTVTEGGPLWNRTAGTAATVTMYASGGTIDGTIDATPNPETLVCLGCHDGTIAIDSISNIPGDAATWTTNTQVMTGYALLDTDLSNDHPVSITYAGDAELDTVANITGAGLELFSGKVECATCHEVHGSSNIAMLRITPTASQICTTCHLK